MIPAAYHVDFKKESCLCMKCYNACGWMENDDVKLWCHRVSWYDASKPKICVHESSGESLLLGLLDGLAEDTFGASSRVMLTKKSVSPAYLYLSVMDLNLTQLVSVLKDYDLMLTGAEKIDLEKSTSEVCSESGGSKRTNNSQSNVLSKNEGPSIKSSGTNSQVIQLHKQEVVKVFFRLMQAESAPTEELLRDTHVHVHECAESLFDSIYSNLVDSTLDGQMGVESEAMGYISRQC